MTIGEQYQDLQRLRSKPCCFVGPDGQVIEPGPVPSRATNLFAGDKENGQVGPLVYLCNEGECTKSFDNMKSISRHLARGKFSENHLAKLFLHTDVT